MEIECVCHLNKREVASLLLINLEQIIGRGLPNKSIDYRITYKNPVNIIKKLGVKIKFRHFHVK